MCLVTYNLLEKQGKFFILLSLNVTLIWHGYLRKKTKHLEGKGKRLLVIKMISLAVQVFWCIGIVCTLPCDCFASKSYNSTAVTQKTNGILPEFRSSNKTFYFHDRKKRENNETEERSLAPQSSNPIGDDGFARTLKSAKLNKVCKLLEKALHGLKEFRGGESASDEGISNLKDKPSKDKSSKPAKPSLCCFPCGCCLMRPMIMYKVKYTPPKFKMKPLKSKTKCGCPHYGVYLGRKRR